ncbi:MAG: shikimate kinase [Paracoccaceae bacterium]
MSDGRTNIVLIGMPGAGKSTIGVLLAKTLTKNFIDTDVLIQRRADTNLQNIIDSRGYEALQAIEREVLLELQCEHTVIATGGSAVYAQHAMAHLQKSAVVVFIDVPLQELRERIHNMDSRGIVQKPGQDFDALFQERWTLYREFADIHITAGSHSQEFVLALIVDALHASQK